MPRQPQACADRATRVDDERLPARFWDKIWITDCWLWAGSLDGCGYGTFKVGSRAAGTAKAERAHRVAYEALVGPIPAGLELDHLCRVRHCVNPSHLEAVDHRTNTLRGDTIVARWAARTHCPAGHAFDEHGVDRPDSGRRCAPCKKVSDAARKRNYREARRG